MSKILGIGNALVDVMTQMEDDRLLENFSIPKGSMQLCDSSMIEQISTATKKNRKHHSSGGSAANSIHALAKLDVNTGFIGSIGEDDTGHFFQHEMVENGIQPYFKRSKNQTGQAVALISPDSERTFTTNLGAAIELTANDLNADWFKDYSILHIEGYLVQNHELLLNAAENAKKSGLQISLDMASFNIVEENLAFLQNFIHNYVDIIFANEEEATAFTGKKPEAAVEEIASLCHIAIVKIGKEGSLIRSDDLTIKIPSVETDVIDTTGAGDAYAGGFLYGLINNYSLQSSAKIGALLASKVINVLGAKIEDQQWWDIKHQISLM